MRRLIPLNSSPESDYEESDVILPTGFGFSSHTKLKRYNWK